MVAAEGGREIVAWDRGVVVVVRERRWLWGWGWAFEEEGGALGWAAAFFPSTCVYPFFGCVGDC